MKIMEVFGSSWDINTLSGAQRAQRQIDAGKRAFKHREMAYELRHEDQPTQQAPLAITISINGKVWTKDGKPVTFRNMGQAQAAAKTIRQRMIDRGQHAEVNISAN